MLVIDGANVVGSRPDGWWRDRAGAAARLHDRLLAAVEERRLVEQPVVLVLEGAARRGVRAGGSTVEVVHADASGDDSIVAVVAERAIESTPGEPGPRGEPVVVVTADRGLRDRVERLGATVVGPGWLLDRL